MTHRRFIVAALLTACAALPVWAADGTVSPTPEDRQVVLVQGGGFSLAGPAYSVPLTRGTDLLGWGGGYRLDAGLQQNLTGGYTAGVGASLGANPGQPGSGYALRLGGGWTGAWFSDNPLSRPGMAEVTPSSDVALSFTYNRSIVPGLSLTGAAEAYRGVATSALDPLGGTSQVVIGAGIGLRF